MGDSNNGESVGADIKDSENRPKFEAEERDGATETLAEEI